MSATERQTLLQVGYRIGVLLMPVVFFAYLDRVNLGFAALAMNHDLSLTNTEFGFAAGCFALGYALFGIPSTLLLHRLGARRWIGITMIAWSLFSAATACVKHPIELYGLRLLLGMAEAGLAPGLVVFASYWFPAQYRGRVFGILFVINPVSQLVSGPLSSVLLAGTGWLGIAGWQWLFIIEALPTLVWAIFIFTALADRPAEAHWLSDQQRQWLNDKLAASCEDPSRLVTDSKASAAFLDIRVWTLVAVIVALGTSGIGTVIFLPLIIRSMGFSIWTTGFVAALPAAAAAVTLPLWGIWTDRAKNRSLVVAAGCGLIAAGLLGTGLLLPSVWALVSLSVALASFFGCLAAFWTLPTVFLTGAAAAAGVGLMNIAGNLGQFAGPLLLGRLSDISHSYQYGLGCLATIAALGGIVVVLHGRRHSTVESSA